MPGRNSRDYVNADGDVVKPGDISVPKLCRSCLKADVPFSKISCSLNRLDQHGSKVFVCFAYEPNSPDIDREELLKKLSAEADAELSEKEQG